MQEYKRKHSDIRPESSDESLDSFSEDEQPQTTVVHIPRPIFDQPGTAAPRRNPRKLSEIVVLLLAWLVSTQMSLPSNGLPMIELVSIAFGVVGLAMIIQVVWLIDRFLKSPSHQPPTLILVIFAVFAVFTTTVLFVRKPEQAYPGADGAPHLHAIRLSFGVAVIVFPLGIYLFWSHEEVLLEAVSPTQRFRMMAQRMGHGTLAILLAAVVVVGAGWMVKHENQSQELVGDGYETHVREKLPVNGISELEALIFVVGCFVLLLTSFSVGLIKQRGRLKFLVSAIFFVSFCVCIKRSVLLPPAFLFLGWLTILAVAYNCFDMDVIGNMAVRSSLVMLVLVQYSLYQHHPSIVPEQLKIVVNCHFAVLFAAGLIVTFRLQGFVANNYPIFAWAGVISLNVGGLVYANFIAQWGVRYPFNNVDDAVLGVHGKIGPGADFFSNELAAGWPFLLATLTDLFVFNLCLMDDFEPELWMAGLSGLLSLDGYLSGLGALNALTDPSILARGPTPPSYAFVVFLCFGILSLVSGVLCSFIFVQSVRKNRARRWVKIVAVLQCFLLAFARSSGVREADKKWVDCLMFSIGGKCAVPMYLMILLLWISPDPDQCCITRRLSLSGSRHDAANEAINDWQTLT